MTQDAMIEKAKPSREAIAGAVAMIRTMDAHDAATAMAERLKLNAEVRVCVGKWDERGSIHGWTKAGNTKEPATVLVEVFVSDLAGEDREFDHYARRMERLLAENHNLRAAYDAAMTLCHNAADECRPDQRVLVDGEDIQALNDALTVVEEAGDDDENTSAAYNPDERLREALEAIVPSKLCGESWNLPDDEPVTITISFGKLKAARSALSPLPQGDDT